MLSLKLITDILLDTDHTPVLILFLFGENDSLTVDEFMFGNKELYTQYLNLTSH